MKLIRFGQVGQEKPGIIDQDGNRRDVSAFGQQYGEAFFGTDGIEKLAGWLSTHLEECPIIPEDVRWGSPLSRPSKGKECVKAKTTTQMWAVAFQLY
ncbi:MAG: hypothetical protein AAF206_18905 [Bacteroidota bacterium]